MGQTILPLAVINVPSLTELPDTVATNTQQVENWRASETNRSVKASPDSGHSPGQMCKQRLQDTQR